MLRDRNRARVKPGNTKSPPPRRPKVKAAPRGPSQRQLRVAEELRHRLAELFGRGDFRDPDLAGVPITVAEVRMSPDLQHATVFVARLGSSDIDALMPALARAAPYLRAETGRGLRLRNIPDLHFQPDHTLDYATKVNEILHLPEVRRDLGTKE